MSFFNNIFFSQTNTEFDNALNLNDPLDSSSLLDPTISSIAEEHLEPQLTIEDERLVPIDFDNPSTFSSVDYDSDSMETKRNNRKRNMQSAESNIFEDKDPKKRRLDHSQMHTIYEPSPDSSSSSSPIERMRSTLASSFNSTTTNVQYASERVLKAVQNEMNSSLPLDSLGSSTPLYNPFLSNSDFSQSQSTETEFNLRKYGLTVEDKMGLYSRAPSSSSSDYMDITRETSSSSSSSSSAVNQDPSSSSSSSEMNILDRDGWCSFNPQRSATRILNQIESGNLNIAEYFPDNNFKITDEEWKTLKEHLPDSIKSLTYPRGLINKFIKFLLHESILDTSFRYKTCIYYEDDKGETLPVTLKDIENDMYETKRQICMRLARFHGFLSMKHKKCDIKSATNIKISFNRNFRELIKNYCNTSFLSYIKNNLPHIFDGQQEIELMHLKFLVMLGMGHTQKKATKVYCRRCQDKELFIENLNDLILNTDLIKYLDEYIRKNCQDLKGYWMPHLI